MSSPASSPLRTSRHTTDSGIVYRRTTFLSIPPAEFPDLDITNTTPNTSNPFNVFQERLVVATIGLPARGKSYISDSIVRFLRFGGCPARLFNVGKLRRSEGLEGVDAGFFDPKNASAAAHRESMAMQCLDELLAWMPKTGCAVGILDATNTTVERRRKLIDRCRHEAAADPCLRLVFIESVVNDAVLLEQNYRMKLENDDYRGSDAERAAADFRDRVRKYESVYETLTDAEEGPGSPLHYIKLVDARQLVAHNIRGYLGRKVVGLLGNIHLSARTIWIVLGGQTVNDDKGVIGGDPELSAEGESYLDGACQILTSLVAASETKEETLFVLTGTSKRYNDAVNRLHAALDAAVSSGADVPSDRPTLTLAAANDLCEGLMDLTSKAEWESRFPDEAAARSTDRLNYRYPGAGGESYQDLVARVSGIVCILEQSAGDSVVFCDRAVFRSIRGYFLGNPIEEIPFLDIQPGILELKRTSRGFKSSHYNVDVGLATTKAGPGTKLY
mmetsp:Transcript_27845/g.55777  ORF Transcript_27845/g.55777 Transcript_27845/m.55777 type:complete len:502 (-) Transcript_27845:42-1547(-)